MKSFNADLPKTTAMATWVKGHQDNKVQYEDLPFKARENINMDRKCESMRISGEPTLPIPYFSSEKVQIAVKGIPVTQQIQEYLHVTTAGPALCKYICKKASWTRDTFDMVNWPALELYLRNLPKCNMDGYLQQNRTTFSSPRQQLSTKQEQLRPAAPSNATRLNTNGIF